MKHKSLRLFNWNVAPVVCLASLAWTGGLTFGLPAIAGVTNISDFIHFFDHDKSISTSQLINGKSRDLQKLLKYFNGARTSASDIFLFGLPITNFVLYSKDYLLLFCCYLS